MRFLRDDSEVKGVYNVKSVNQASLSQVKDQKVRHEVVHTFLPQQHSSRLSLSCQCTKLWVAKASRHLPAPPCANRGKPVSVYQNSTGVLTRYS